jgi:molybdate transport repressor ModE-like protein
MSAQPGPLPSLKALHALARVAETGSIAEAARQLGVTASAVSHLLRDLEGQLATRLLDRGGPGVRLTEEGRALVEELGPAFARIALAVRRLRRQRAELRITTLSSFAQCWLLPRLPAFQAAQPGVDLFVSTSVRLVDLDLESIDAAIRWGEGRWPGLAAELVYREVMMAVAHPRLAARMAGADAAAIAALPLIHGRLRREDWPEWLAAAGHASPLARAGLTVETRGLAIRAALAGSGAIVVDRAFVTDELASGQLVQLSPLTLERPAGYWLVWSERRVPRPAFRAFQAWLRQQVAEPAAAGAAVLPERGHSF